VEQLVARRAHNPKATGSSPVPATNEFLIGLLCESISYNEYGGVAQLARAFGSYPKGPGFESLCRHQSYYVILRLLTEYFFVAQIPVNIKVAT
jgi:hypothetical protein